MPQRQLLILIAVSASLLFIGTDVRGANLFSAHFDFTAPFLTEQNVEGLAILSAGGLLSVTPTGGLIGGSAADDAAVDTIRGDWGLGLLNQNVAAGADRSSLFRRIHVDGSNQPEVLRLEFALPVQIDKIFFSYVGPFEKFDLSVDGVDIDIMSTFGADEIYKMAPAGMAKGTVLFPQSLPFGTVWDFYARSSTDEWNIEGLSVTAVPEPSSLVGLLGLALSGCVVASRRRRHISA